MVGEREMRRRGRVVRVRVVNCLLSLPLHSSGVSIAYSLFMGIKLC